VTNLSEISKVREAILPRSPEVEALANHIRIITRALCWGIDSLSLKKAVLRCNWDRFYFPFPVIGEDPIQDDTANWYSTVTTSVTCDLGDVRKIRDNMAYCSPRASPSRLLTGLGHDVWPGRGNRMATVWQSTMLNSVGPLY
jgi:hypothetical protein